MTLVYLIIFATSVLLSFGLTKYVRDAAMARGWVTEPLSDRHVHRKPLPRLGGVAIFLAFQLSLAVVFLIGLWRPSLASGISASSIWKIMLPASLIFGLGVADDIRPLNAYVKFTGQAVAGGILFAGGLRVLDLPLFFGFHHQFSWFLSLPITILWVLAITNAFNLIDGLDGLAAGSALFSTMVVFVVSLVSHSGLVSLMALALAGCILGFLRFNFNPATIFLGDCGSLFIGFMLSALALRGAQKTPTIVAVAIPVVSFGLPILETALSIVRRLISGRPVFIGDREHIHHKLLQRGLTQRQVVIILYGVSAIFALLSLFLLWPTGSTLALVLAVLGTGVWVGVQHLGYLEFGELRRVAQRTIEQRQVFINNLAVRRATEELKVARSYEQLWRVLEAAFTNNDFDAVELRVSHPVPAFLHSSLAPLVLGEGGCDCLKWQKPGDRVARRSNSWNLSLDLVSQNNQSQGTLALHRLYGDRDLQLDINLLTSSFAMALAEALSRAREQTVAVAVAPSDPSLLPARLG